jgi:hypothetical protein
VYMRDEDDGSLINIAEYDQEYDKEDPVWVQYHGFGHYDSLQIAHRSAMIRMYNIGVRNSKGMVKVL